MDPFEEYLTKFESTIYGTEMRDSLRRCFNLLLSDILQKQLKLDNIRHRIEEIEEGKKNG